MTADEESKIVNASAEALMEWLSANGKTVEAVVTVVLFKGGEDYHIGTRLDLEKPPANEEEAERVQGRVLLSVSDLLDSYVHESGLCEDCNTKKGTVQ